MVKFFLFFTLSYIVIPFVNAQDFYGSKWDIELSGHLPGNFKKQRNELHPNWNLGFGCHVQIPFKGNLDGRLGIRFSSNEQLPMGELEQVWPNFEIDFIELEVPVGFLHRIDESNGARMEWGAGMGLGYRVVGNYIVSSTSSLSNGHSFIWHNEREHQTLYGFGFALMKYYPSFLRKRVFIQSFLQMTFYGNKKIVGDILDENENVLLSINEPTNVFNIGIGLGYSLYGKVGKHYIRNRTDVPFFP